MFSYLSWHYKIKLRLILTIWNNFLLFFFHYFSILELFQTLFAPWKKETLRVTHIFPLGPFLEAASFNLVSRSIGFLIRTVTIWLGLMVLLFVTYVGLLVTLAWICIPIFTLPFYIWESVPPEIDRAKRDAKTMKELCVRLWRTHEGEFVKKRLQLGDEEIKQLTLADMDAALPNEVHIAAKISELFALLASGWTPFRLYLKSKKLNPEDVVEVARWYEQREQRGEVARRFWDRSYLLRIPGLARDWAYGYTTNLERYAEELSIDGNPLGELVGRENEIKELEEILSKTTHNSVILTGDEGVGKQPIIEMLATKIARGEVYPALHHKRVLAISLPQLLKDSGDPGVMHGSVLAILREAEEAGNIILVIKDIDRYLCQHEPQHNLSEVIAQTLRSGRLQVVGTSTSGRYHTCIVPNEAVRNLFEKIDVSEPNLSTIMETLETITSIFERTQRVFVTYQTLQEVIKTSSRYLPELPYPQKAIDILDKTIVHTKSLRKTSVVLPEHVDEVMTSMSHMPVGKLDEVEREKLQNLESYLHQHVIGQHEAVAAVASAMRRSRLEVSDTARPIGAFLFLGPTGVGKTETAKSLARLYFGSEKQMVRLDMSQFQDNMAIHKLIGGAGAEFGLLTSAVRDNPFCVLLLDEFEKAAPKIHNLFLTVFDEGYITDEEGKKVFFNHTIIIATSNAQAQFIHMTIGEGKNPDNIKQELIERMIADHIFTPELINRFDEIVIFKPLTAHDLMAIARLQLSRLSQQLEKEYDLKVNFSDPFIADIIKDGYDPAFGARPMKRVIQKNVEDVLAQKLLSGEVKRGQTVEF